MGIEREYLHKGENLHSFTTRHHNSKRPLLCGPRNSTMKKTFLILGASVLVLGIGLCAVDIVLDTPGLNVENHVYDASFNGEELEIELEVYANAGNSEADIDMTAEDFDNMDNLENIHFYTIEIEWSDLVPALSHQVRAVGAAFMKPIGDAGFRFSYKGSAAGLNNVDF